MKDFVTIKSELSDEQRDFLTAIWKHYLAKNRAWPPKRLLYKNFGGKAAIDGWLANSLRDIVFGTEMDRIPAYGLTFLGLLLTPDGAHIEELIVNFLRYASRKVLEEPYRTQISHEEAQNDMMLSANDVNLLGNALILSHLCGGGSIGENQWSTDIPKDVDELPADLLSHIRRVAVENALSSFPALAEEKKEKSIFSFVSEERLRLQLESDWQEAQKTASMGAWKSCIILCGGILEGMLLDVLNTKREQAPDEFERLKQKKPFELSKWHLVDLVEVAKELGLLSQEASHLSHALRLYRDLIHPGRQIRENIAVSQLEASLGLSIVESCAKELKIKLEQ